MTLFTGQQIISLKSVDSTNDYASRWVKENGFPEGLIVISEEQTAGKGQRGNNWKSEKGQNLLFSLVMKPVFLSPDKQFYLSKITSLAVKDTLEKYNVSCSVKWPNDIYISGRKVAGILIENNISGNLIKTSIIGVGINVNQRIFEEGINATSLALETGINYDLKEILQEFCSAFESYYLELNAGKTETINKKYLDSLLNYNVAARYRNREKEFQGIIIAVKEDGKLEMMNCSDNRTEYYGMKEISLVIN